MIAAGDHPVPIDLETHPAGRRRGAANAQEPRTEAFARRAGDHRQLGHDGRLAARPMAQSPDNTVFAMGGMTLGLEFAASKLAWSNINSDTMRPAKTKESATRPTRTCRMSMAATPSSATMSRTFIAGFEDYAKFLLRRSRDAASGRAVRRLCRLAGPQGRSSHAVLLHAAAAAQKPSQHGRRRRCGRRKPTSSRGCRIGKSNSDPMWPLHRAERAALLTLNVPHFVSPSDGNEIRDASGISVSHTVALGARSRARAGAQLRCAGNRLADRGDPGRIPRRFQARRSGSREAADSCAAGRAAAPAKEIFVSEADRIAAELAVRAIRRGSAPPGSVSTGWAMPRSVSSCRLGPDLYNGVSGIARVSRRACRSHRTRAVRPSLRSAAIAASAQKLKDRNAARIRALARASAARPDWVRSSMR